MTYWLLDEDSRVRKERRGYSRDSGRGTASEPDTPSLITTQNIHNDHTGAHITNICEGDNPDSDLNKLSTMKEPKLEPPGSRNPWNTKPVEGLCERKTATRASLHQVAKDNGVNDKSCMYRWTTNDEGRPGDSDSTIIEQSILASLTDHVREHICRMNSMTSGLYRSNSSPSRQVEGLTKKNVAFHPPRSLGNEHPSIRQQMGANQETGSPRFSQSVKVNKLTDGGQDIDSLAKVSVNV